MTTEETLDVCDKCGHWREEHINTSEDDYCESCMCNEAPLYKHRFIEESNLYPNGQCDACGYGLAAYEEYERACINPECSRCVCHADCGPVTAHVYLWHAHDGGDNGICWHEDEA